jgi:hypothetical protein
MMNLHGMNCYCWDFIIIIFIFIILETGTPMLGTSTSPHPPLNFPKIWGCSHTSPMCVSPLPCSPILPRNLVEHWIVNCFLHVPISVFRYAFKVYLQFLFSILNYLLISYLVLCSEFYIVSLILLYCFCFQVHFALTESSNDNLKLLFPCSNFCLWIRFQGVSAVSILLF